MRVTYRELSTEDKDGKIKLFIGLAYDHFADTYRIVDKDNAVHKVIMLEAGQLVGENDQYYVIRSMNRDITNPATDRGEEVNFLMKCAVIAKQIIEVDFNVRELVRKEGIEIFDKRLVEEIRYRDFETKEDGSNERASDDNAGKSD